MTIDFPLVSAVALVAASFAFACSNEAPSDNLGENASAVEPGQGALGNSQQLPPASKTCGASGKPTLVPGAAGDCDAPPAPPAPAPAPAPAPQSDAGDAGPASTQGACAGGVCKPGSVRYCDNDVEDWSLQQKCSPAGQWSPCTTSNTSPAGAGPIKDKKSCMANKLCCQEDEEGPFFDYGTGACAALECAK